MKYNFSESPLGELIIVSSGNGLCVVEFADDRQQLIHKLEKKFNGHLNTGIDPIIEKCKIQLTEYFNGKRKEFDIPFDLSGSDFQKKVWNLLGSIPYGKTISYLDFSKKYGDPKAIRAIASANGDNPLAIIIPCHRVIGSDGSLIGYAGGLARKQWLLEHEQDFSGHRQEKLF